MITKISEAEARKNNLNGCYSFKRSGLAYKDDLHRDMFAISLYHEAYKIFLSSILISRYNIFKEEARKFQESLNNGTHDMSTYQMSTTRSQRIEYINLENFYIATGFELSLKSRLLENNYLINCLEGRGKFKSLRKMQKERPVHKDELFAISGYFYDEILQRNELVGITEESLNFKLICTEVNYSNTFNLSADLLSIIEDYRNLRNQIHLPGDFPVTPNLSRLGDTATPLIINFINTEIVDRANILNNRHRLKYSELERLSA